LPDGPIEKLEFKPWRMAAQSAATRIFHSGAIHPGTVPLGGVELLLRVSGLALAQFQPRMRPPFHIVEARVVSQKALLSLPKVEALTLVGGGTIRSGVERSAGWKAMHHWTKPRFCKEGFQSFQGRFDIAIQTIEVPEILRIGGRSHAVRVAARRSASRGTLSSCRRFPRVPTGNRGPSGLWPAHVSSGSPRFIPISVMRRASPSIIFGSNRQIASAGPAAVRCLAKRSESKAVGACRQTMASPVACCAKRASPRTPATALKQAN